jgi:TPP-dependent pyruvate/acetoin dehydrogenase alpha subunit
MGNERLLGLYEQMLRIRGTEEAIEELREDGHVVGSVHLSSGQEAVAVGVIAERAPHDPVFGNYRGHGWAVACGAPPEKVIAELAGRADGVSGGRGGSAFFSAPEWGFLGENAIIGAQAPIAVGAALAARHDGSDRVAITVFGDGAVNQGAVSEAFNMAGAWKLPVVFVLENNVYSELTPIAAMVSDPDLSRRGEAFGIPGARVDGNDVEAVAAAAAAAFEKARAGEGPTLIQADTYRIVGHYIGDAESYRDQAEVEEARKTEPLVVARARLAELGTPAASIEEAERRVEAELREAVSSALASPPSDPDQIQEHLYA